MSTIPFSAERIRDARVAEAEAYVRTRFFPPLPYQYGALAVEAVDALNSGDFDYSLDVTGLNPEPRGTFEALDGRRLVPATVLVEALRLWHLIDTDEEV